VSEVTDKTFAVSEHSLKVRILNRQHLSNNQIETMCESRKAAEVIKECCDHIRSIVSHNSRFTVIEAKIIYDILLNFLRTSAVLRSSTAPVSSMLEFKFRFESK